MMDMVIVFLAGAAIGRARGYPAPVVGVTTVLLFMAFSVFVGANFIDESESLSGTISKIILAGIFAVTTVSIALLLLRKRDVRTRPKSTPFPFRLIGLLFILLSIIIPFAASLVTGASAGAAAAFIALSAAGGYCFMLESQKRAKGARELLASDPRPPVVYLRSFECGEIRGPLPVTFRAFLPWHRDFFRKLTGITFDDLIATHVQRDFGPFIALGDPEDDLPEPGSAKLYVNESTTAWMNIAVELLNKAGLILVSEGATPGLGWELGYIRNNCSPERVFLLIPPQGFKRKEWIWPRFTRLLSAASYGVRHLQDTGAGAVISFDADWCAYVCLTDATRSEEYVSAIQATRKFLTSS